MNETEWACAFCGKHGKASEEHVIAKRLAKITPGEGPFIARRENKLSGQLDEWQHPTLVTVTNKATCTSCNNEWMSSLEDRAAPVLKPMIQGSAGEFEGPATQLALATWVAKTAMMLDLSYPGVDRHIPPRQLRYLYDRRHPPASCFIWLYYYRPLEGEEWRAAWSERTQLTFTPESGEPRNGYLSTFSVGHLACQVLGYASTKQRDVEPRAPADEVHRPIWPLNVPSVFWPPPLGVSTKGLDRLPKIVS